MEHDEQADALERQVEDMQRQNDEVGSHIDDARSDLESKIGDATAPGLQDERHAAPGGLGPEGSDESENVSAGSDADEDEDDSDG
jgi:hypothetical protein